jgi:hypothetical protein
MMIHRDARGARCPGGLATAGRSYQTARVADEGAAVRSVPVYGHVIARLGWAIRGQAPRMSMPKLAGGDISHSGPPHLPCLKHVQAREIGLGGTT